MYCVVFRSFVPFPVIVSENLTWMKVNKVVSLHTVEGLWVSGGVNPLVLSSDLNGLFRFAERQNLVSAGVSSCFNWPLLMCYRTAECLEYKNSSFRDVSAISCASRALVLPPSNGELSYRSAVSPVCIRFGL